MDKQIEIINYTANYQQDFRRLNVEWLDKYQLTESLDLVVLDDPQTMILDKGGYIWLARIGNEIVGSAALIKEHHGIYELAKMAVDPAHQGKGISKLLIETCLAKAREIGAKKLELFSHHSLTTALNLYKKYGFTHIDVIDSPFETADVKMELVM